MADPDHDHDVDDDGRLDGCELDFAEHAVDDETALLTAMFADVPDDQVAELEAFYREGAASDA